MYNKVGVSYYHYAGLWWIRVLKMPRRGHGGVPYIAHHRVSYHHNVGPGAHKCLSDCMMGCHVITLMGKVNTEHSDEAGHSGIMWIIIMGPARACDHILL